MRVANHGGYITLTSPFGEHVYVRVSKISYIIRGGDAETLVTLDGDIQLHVKEKVDQIFEKINTYIAPEMR